MVDERGPQKEGREIPGCMGGEDPSNYSTGGQQPEQPRSSPRCPSCGATESEVISLFGTQAMTLQYRCRGCGDFYEALKYDGDDAP